MNNLTLEIVVNEWDYWAEYCYDEKWANGQESYTGGAVYFFNTEEIYIFLSEWHQGPTWVNVTLVDFLITCYTHELIHHMDNDVAERLVANAEFALVGWITNGEKRQG